MVKANVPFAPSKLFVLLLCFIINFRLTPLELKALELQTIRGDETVNVNKPSPVSPQLTARSGQSAQLVQVTHCIRTHVNLHSDF
jgi:hypothetical protein